MGADVYSESVVQYVSVIKLSAAGTAWLLSSTGNPAHSENSLDLQNPSPGSNNNKDMNYYEQFVLRH